MIACHFMGAFSATFLEATLMNKCLSDKSDLDHMMTYMLTTFFSYDLLHQYLTK